MLPAAAATDGGRVGGSVGLAQHRAPRTAAGWAAATGLRRLAEEEAQDMAGDAAGLAVGDDWVGAAARSEAEVGDGLQVYVEEEEQQQCSAVSWCP